MSTMILDGKVPICHNVLRSYSMNLIFMSNAIIMHAMIRAFCY